MTTTMRVAILGPLEVHTADGALEIPGRRLRALLIRLALAPGRVVSADRLIDDLWQDEPPAAAHNALQALVSRLRAVVGRTTIESGGGGYRLNIPPDCVDLVLFEQRVRAGRAAREAGDAVASAKQLRAALGLWRGDALSDVEGTPFAEVEAAGLEEQRVAAVEDLVDAVLAQTAATGVAAAEAADLLPELEQLRAAFPLREKLHARYMRVLYALGRQAEALAAYEQLRTTLADRLGVDPSPELSTLHLAMLRQAPDLPSLAQPAPHVTATPTPPPQAVPSASPATRPYPGSASASPPRQGNLPAQLTSFIGRETELELVAELLQGARLVTLIGPGGAGKTRLAQECGARLGEVAADGVWIAPLAAVADGANVAQAVLAALGGENTVSFAELALDRAEALTPRERLHALLADRRMILILDNCEHVLDAVAELVDQLLSAAPRVRILATSREPLALTGETLCPVASLALPPDPSEQQMPRPFDVAPTELPYPHPSDTAATAVESPTTRPADGPTTERLAPRPFHGAWAEPSVARPFPVTPAEPPAARPFDAASPESSATRPFDAASAEPPAVHSLDGASAEPSAARSFHAASAEPPAARPLDMAWAEPPASRPFFAAPTVPSPPAVESVLEYPSVQLFVERARAVRPGFQLTSANVTPVIRICRALDGIPLAIELAAARLRSLSAQQVADRLDDRFRLLSSGSRTALPRHQTLRAIVDWSWELLSPAERTVLARLAVFAGGATPDAAIQVCSHAASPTSPAPDADVDASAGAADAAARSALVLSVASVASDEVIDIIASLVDKSLVVAQEDEVGEVRYRLLETVRAYSADRLEESGERTSVRAAHAEHFVALAERAEPELRAAEQIHWITRLSLERDNFNAALRHCVATGEFGLALRLYQGLLWFWMMRNHGKEAAQWAEEVSELIVQSGVEVPAELGEAYLLCVGVRKAMAAMREHAGDVEAVSNALISAVPENSYTARHPLLALIRPVAGVLISRGGDGAAARRELDALADHPEPWVRAARYSFTALLELHYAQATVAEDLLLTGYAKFRELGERQGLLFTLVVLTEFALAKGEFRVAVSRAEEAYGYATDGLNPDSGSMLLIKLGQTRACAGEIEYGRRLMEQGTRTAEHCGESGDAAVGHAELAALAFKVDDPAEARRQLAMATSLIGAFPDRPDMALASSVTLARRGYLAALEGEFDVARDCYRQAVDAVRFGPFLSFMSGLDEVLRGLAAVAGLQGDHVRAAELLGSARSVVGMDNEASYVGPRTKSAAIAALGEEAFEDAFARGQRARTVEVLALESGQASPATGPVTYRIK